MTKVHPRVHQRHPEIDDEDVIWAWENCVVIADRIPNDTQLRVGFDLKGRELEMIGWLTVDGWMVFHAFTPPTKKFKAEIEAKGRRL